MGEFAIHIRGTGNHGDERDKGHGADLEFTGGGVDATVKKLVDELSKHGTLVEATLTHWPGTTSQVVDDVLHGKRLGTFGA